MKVLHVWNTAGVASLISKELKKKGVKSDVFMRASHDPFKFSEFYGDDAPNISGNEFIKQTLLKAGDYDIIHVHAAHRILEPLREKYPNKKIVFQYHGSELTNNGEQYVKQIAKLSNEIITSTKDLHEQLTVNNTLVQNAVDQDLFKPIDCAKDKRALFILSSYLNLESCIDIIKGFVDWDIYVYDRNKKPVSYKDMPSFLNRFDRLIDIKVGNWMVEPSGDLSKTGREALACGLTVLNYKGELISELPKEYTTDEMINKIISIYIKE